MLPVIKRYEPPIKRRLRIKSKVRLIVSLILIVCTSFAFSIPKKGASQVEFVEYQVKYGDTYWQIAKQLQKQGYRSRDDIRDIIHELVRKSGIMAHELREGDTIYIPDLGVEK
jgi:hypothetical protein